MLRVRTIPTYRVYRLYDTISVPILLIPGGQLLGIVATLYLLVLPITSVHTPCMVWGP